MTSPLNTSKRKDCTHSLNKCQYMPLIYGNKHLEQAKKIEHQFRVD